MQAGRHQARNVRHIDHQHCANRIRNCAESRKIQRAGVSAAAGHDHPRLVFVREPRHLIEVDLLGILVHLIRRDVVCLAGKIQLVAVRQMSAMREIEPHDGIAGLQNRAVSRLIRLRPGVRLNIGVFRFEELPGAVAGQVLHLVGVFAAAVISLAGIAPRHTCS